MTKVVRSVASTVEPISAHGEQSLLGGARSGWQGFPIEWIQADPVPDPLRNFELEAPILCMIDEGCARASFGIRSRTHDLDLDAESIGFFAAGTYFHHSIWECQSVKRIALRIDFERVSSMGLRMVSEPGALTSHLKFHDKGMAQLLRCMVREVASGSVNGPLYAESLSVGLIARLVSTFSSNPGELNDKARLTAAQVRQLKDLVQANIDQRLTLGQLAQAAGYSAAHFVRLFRNTFDCTPHQYVVRTRLELARDLVTQTKLSLSQIAAATGFASQSHMTSTFSTVYRESPGSMRRQQKASTEPRTRIAVQ